MKNETYVIGTGSYVSPKKNHIEFTVKKICYTKEEAFWEQIKTNNTRTVIMTISDK